MISSLRSKLVLFAALQICYLLGNVEAYQALLCEGTSLPLACPPDNYISVSSAFFGRSNVNLCPNANASLTNTTTCSASQATVVVQGLCEGRVSCDVTALTSFFGDPCAGIAKYLVINYACNACVNNLGDDAACEQRALKGDCINNATDMIANCSKACYKCQSKIDPGCTNLYADVNCTQWAAAGQCNANPSFMTPYCKKACQLCDAPTPCVNNNGNDTLCNLWMQNAQCTNNSGYMLGGCSKSCFGCKDTITCQNQNTACDNWAIAGECNKNPGYMMASCTKSCLGCTVDPVCVDKSSQCANWSGSGECVNNPIWMYQNCWQSCLQCKSAPVCMNNATITDAKCEGWAKNGECVKNPVWMIVNCRQACTRCQAYPNGVPNCANMYGNDTQCNLWVKNGECSNTPAFMFPQCYQSCTGCSGSTYYVSRAGYPAIPGLQSDVTAGYSVVIPFYFPTSAIVYQFSAFFINTNPVHLQIWRPNGYPNGSPAFNLVYDYLFTPPAANIAATVALPSCWLVNYGDQFGFTSVTGAASISYTTEKGNAFNQLAYRQAIYNSVFFFSWSSIDYSLAAQFYSATTC